MSRQLVAVVNVYEVTPIGGYQVLHKNVRLTPDVYNYVTEDGIKFASHWFHLKVATYEGMEGKNERNN